MSEHKIVVFGDPPRRGRPPAREPLAPVTVRLTATEHDKIISAATTNRVTVSAFLRMAARRALRPPD